MELLDRRGIRREYTLVASTKHNGVAEQKIAGTLELSIASCLNVSRLFDAATLQSTGAY